MKMTKKLNKKGGIASQIPTWAYLLIFLAVMMAIIGFAVAPAIKGGLARLLQF